MMTEKRFWVLSAAVTALAVLLVLLMFFAPREMTERLSTGQPAYVEKLFGQDILTMDIRMDPNEWEAMLENARAEEYTACDVTVNGTLYTSAAIRPKGNTSLIGVSNMDSDRYSFKIKFDEYVDGQTCQGLSKLVLNNLYADATYMKEFLSYDLLGWIGVPSPCFTYAEITLNGEPFGLYLALEPLEEEFAERSFGSDYGALYKPESEGGGSGLGGSGNDLVYTDNDPNSYSAIFKNAVFKTREEDEIRVIEALEHLDKGEDLAQYIDVDEVLRYFAANVFLVNLDSYLSNLKHNYYLYEQDGRLSMLPWDYNLSFGAHQIHSASDAVNFPIDTPYSGTSAEKSPILAKLLEVEEYRGLYHQHLKKIAGEYFLGGQFTDQISRIDKLIAPYVQTDATAFYSYTEYQKAADTLKAYGLLRAQSVSGQLDGSIPSTTEGQQADSSGLVDASAITLSDMGQMNMGGRGGAQNPDWRGEAKKPSDAQPPFPDETADRQAPPDGGAAGLEFPGMPPKSMPEGVMGGQSGKNGVLPDFSAADARAFADKGGVRRMEEGPQNGWPPDGGGFPGDPEASRGQPEAALSRETLIQAGLCLGILLIGLCFVSCFRRRKLGRLN